MRKAWSQWVGRGMLLGLLGAGLVVGTAGCGAAEEVDQLYDCQSVCSRYQSCFDSKYDVAACRARCKTNSEKDMEYRRKAELCETCIDDRSCKDATFKCATECAGIVGG